MTTEKEIEKQKLLKELIESSKLQEHRITAAHVVPNQDSQKVANAIKCFMNKEWM